MPNLTTSSVTRKVDSSGDEIAAFRKGSTGSFVQQMALVDEAGSQIAVSGNPLYISLTGDGTLVLDSDSIDALTSATSTTESKIIDSTGQQIGLSSDPMYVSLTSTVGAVNSSGVIKTENLDHLQLLSDMVKELKKITLHLSLINGREIQSSDTEV